MLLPKNRQELVRDFSLVILHGFLLLPILNLLLTINHVPWIGSVYIFFILAHLASLILRKGWLYSLFQVFASFFFLYRLFSPATDSLFFRERLLELWALGLSQWQDLLDANLTEVPYLLLLSGTLLLINLLTYLLMYKNQALPSFFSGLLYLMILHTFTSRTVMPHLIPFVGFGIILISFTQINTQTSWVAFASSAGLTLFFTALLIGFSYFSLGPLRPTQEWVETKSNAYQKNLDDRGVLDWINDNSVGIGFRRTGMGTDDTELGGRLHQDFSPVFRAYTTRPHYWKVLHRTEYTGFGWKSDYDDYFNAIRSPFNTRLDEENPDIQREDMLQSENVSSVTLEWLNELTYLAYPYGWFDIELAETENDYAMELNSHSGYFTVQGESASLTHYTLAYDRTLPDRFDAEALEADDGWREEIVKAYKEMNPDNAAADISGEELFHLWFEHELQLPSRLPDRVSELAEELTDGLNTEYAMVRAIETYLKADGGYRYSLLDVENTPENGDYVDHFLFESKVGYCDNFSSAMTILLRTLGIPTRWAKGFTPGSQIVSETRGTYYLVDNSNAHSWPEVYFPSYGWIPFEPSPSFANPVTDPDSLASVRGETYSFDDQDTIEINDAEIPSPEEPTTEDSPASDILDLSEESINGEEDQDASSDSASEADQRRRTTLYSSIAVILLLLGWIIIFRWHTLLWLIKLLIKKDVLSLTTATRLVLRLYYLKLKPSKGQTVQMYFNHWKPYASGHVELIDRFTDLADTAFYNNRTSRTSLTTSHKEILTDMLDVYTSQPRIHGDASQTYYRSR